MFRERMKGSVDLLALAVLAAAPAHGYEVAERLRRQSHGVFDLPEGTIYPALHRLGARGWVASSWTLAGGRRRRVYALTDRGHRQLAPQRQEGARFIAGMPVVLETEPA